MKTIIEHYVSDGSTVNIRALDISKAFDCVDHFALLKLLTDRKLPRAFIGVMSPCWTGSLKALYVSSGLEFSHFGFVLKQV